MTVSERIGLSRLPRANGTRAKYRVLSATESRVLAQYAYHTRPDGKRDPTASGEPALPIWISTERLHIHENGE